jgi:CheY-like chemotaxis protein
MLVEDNEVNRDMLSRRLIRKGFEVLIAIDGEQVAGLLAEQRPDLILMDINLPGKDGHEITGELKRDSTTADIPVIALTAHAMLGDRDKAIAAGCDDYDTKPVDMPRLLGKINTLLNR